LKLHTARGPADADGDVLLAVMEGVEKKREGGWKENEM
jgi:hypothetical protein